MGTDLPTRLELARVLAGLSMQELSKLSGLAGSHARLIARGAVRSPRVEAAERLARTLGVSLDWLVSGIGPEPTPASVQAAVAKAREARAAA